MKKHNLSLPGKRLHPGRTAFWKRLAAGLMCLFCCAGLPACAAQGAPAAAGTSQAEESGAAAQSPEQRAYKAMEQSILAQQDTVVLHGIGKTEFDRLYETLSHDPSLLGFAGCTYTYTATRVEVSWNWRYPDVPEKITAARAAAAQIAAGISRDASDYEKALYVHDWLCENVSYALGTDGSDQDIYGALVQRSCVCNGYCKAFQYLLQLLGVEASTILGTAADGSAHSWNSAVLEGELYYFDITWDDQENIGPEYGVGRDWFALTSEEIGRSHIPADPADQPESTADAENYYTRSGYVLQDYSKDAVERIFAQQPEGRLVVKAVDETVYNALCGALLDDGAVHSILKNLGLPYENVSYTKCEELYILTVLPQ